MNLQSFLNIAGKPVNVQSHMCRQRLNASGNAIFTVLVSNEREATTWAEVATYGATVQFSSSYKASENWPFFTGFIESLKEIKTGLWQISCLEFSSLLKFKTLLSFRHENLETVLNELSARIKVPIIFPDVDYMSSTQARFLSIGTGRHALLQAGKIFKVPEFIFYQKASGEIWAGAWQDSFYAARGNHLNEALINEQSLPSSAGIKLSVGAIPSLTTGCMINDNIVSELVFKGNAMQLTLQPRGLLSGS